MAFFQVSFCIAKSNIEAAQDLLSGLGAQAITFLDAQDTPIYEPKLNETEFWELTIITGLFEYTPDFDLEKFKENIISGLSDHNIPTNPLWANQLSASPALNLNTKNNDQITIKKVVDKSWIKETQSQFTPMQFGEKLWICPSWETPPDPKAINLLLDPGLAFGTGTHATTALCLEWLEKHLIRSTTVIDYGCGSGILSIAAIKLGATVVHSIDLDPQALISTNHNAKQNNISTDHIKTYLPEAFAKQYPSLKTDFIIANILSEPLKTLKPIFKKHLKPNGRLVLSGLLERQTNEMIETYQDAFKDFLVTQKDGWVLIESKLYIDF